MSRKAKKGLPGRQGKHATLEERREYRRAYMAQYIPADPDRIRKQKRDSWRLKNGLPQPTRAEPAACEICGAPPSGTRNERNLHLDHCHLTGVFRGWLCGNCNRALGLLKDSSDLCIAAARYLRAVEL